MRKSGKKSMQAARSTLAIVYALAFFGGATALAHQLLWTRRMVDLLGASAGSAARVFGCFFMGLALGAMLGAILANRVRRPWRWLAAAEVAIACLSVPILLLPWWADGIWPWLGPDRLIGPLGGTLKTVLSVLLVLPPAVMMGLFLPLAVRDWPFRLARKTDPGLWLYAINTAGAVMGLLAVAAWMLPRFSMLPVMTFIIIGNLIAAIGCYVVDLLLGPVGQVNTTPESLRASRPAQPYLIMAAASGFLIMATEVIALLMTQLLAPMSFFAPAAVLGSVIAALAFSAFVVALGAQRSFFREAGFVPILASAGLLIALTPLLFHALAPQIDFASGSRSLFIFLLQLSLFVALVFGPAIIVAGFWFPLIANASGQSDEPRSRLRWGWLLAANGLGGLLGAEIAYRVLLPLFGPHQGLGVIGFVYLIAAWIYAPSLTKPAGLWAVRVAMALIIGLLLFALPRLHSVNPSLAPVLLAEQHGREGSLAILDHPRMGRAIVLQNQYVLGASSASAEAERQAHIPLMLHAAPRHVAFIGLATGITAGGALKHSAVEQIEAVEISRAVTRAAGEWFTDYNRGVMNDDRARIVVEDGRTWLAAHADAFDVIISDLFLPWGPGEGRLYTIEHFAAARRALRDEGLFCLWLPMYQLNNDQFMVILNSFLHVFPEAQIFRRETSAGAPALGLMGWRSAELRWHDVQQRLALAEIHRDEYFEDLDQFRALFVGTVERGTVSGPVNTLDNLWIELDAGRYRILFGEAAPYFSGDRWTRWLESFQQQLVARSP